MPMTTEFDRMAIYNEEVASIKFQGPLTTWIARSGEKFDALYLYYNKIHGHQTWQGGDFLWEASCHKITPSFECMVTWGHVIN